MDKFWKWMEEKGYGYGGDLVEWHPLGHGTNINATQQMLIGYMMEYLDDAKQDWGVEEYVQNTTEGRYEWLESKINSLGE